MNISVRKKEEVVILDLEGSIDINSSDFVETVGWALMHKSKDILCNFEKINLIDYIGISLIAVAYKNVLNHKGRMKFFNIPFHITKLFSIVGMDRALEIYPDEEVAVQSFKEEKVMEQILNKKLRRRFKRVPLKSIIEYRPKFPNDNNPFYQGHVVNLSGIGVFVISEKLFSMGDILTTRIHLLPKPGIIESEMKVVWRAGEEVEIFEFPGMGLEFHNIDPKVQEEIVAFVEKHLTHTSQE